MFKVRLLASTAVIASAITPAFPQTYPSKPIRLVITGSPGSATDIRGRWLAPKLTAALGQTIVVDNRVGAGGTIATEAVARSAPDGYTVLVVHQGTLAFNPHMYKRVGYDPIADFAPVTLIGTSPLLLAVNPKVPANSVAELVQLAKQKPGQLHYGSPGSGTPPHIAGELFKRVANIDVTHVPYKGGAAALVDLMGGRVAYTFDSAAVQLPNARAGKIKMLAVTSSQRIPALPDIRTIAESGLPGYEFWAWQGIAAPAGTPRSIIARLHSEIVKIMSTPEAREWFGELGIEPTTNTPQEFAAYIKAEHARWGPVIRDANIKAD